MSEQKYPIVLKRRNGMMIGAVILEFIVAVIFGITLGFNNICFLIFLFTAIITALSVFLEKGEIINLKENKIEVYKNEKLVRTIKYNNIHSISLEKGEEKKNAAKDFIVINYVDVSEKKHKNKELKIEKCFINPMNYSLNDLKAIQNAISEKNKTITIEEKAKKYLHM